MYADALLASHPRSGGRWLRYLLAHYLAAHHRLDVEVTPQTVFAVVPDHHEEGPRGYRAFQFRGRRNLPLAAVCHQPYSWELHRGYPVVYLARNAYDVIVSAYVYYTQEKPEYSGSMRDFIRHPRLGLGPWIEYVNSWAPALLTHRDAVLLSYRDLNADPEAALTRVLGFLNQAPDPALVQATVRTAGELRSARGIRTGQEGNFWDHLQPDEIFDIQERLDRGLSKHAVHLLQSMGVEVDPFPRDD
ncbi:sulfotransferase domain-containing protein [Longimicrobium sp.]|uniref:sulfotransferase domain-containing protein n=1 Tax=Longimicrobium sp. TaxID=2029185 RepID=UPI002E355823|nr:sulfotransferase domain-containing protein [Longimicrobium sp.]HEX6039862.1 sulfotransferase domain-containing protein [Longimicrobium sp.]